MQLGVSEQNGLKFVNQQYAAKGKEFFAHADGLRGVCADRLKKKGRQLPTDANIDDVFKSLVTEELEVPPDRDAEKMSTYLLELCKRLR